MKIAAQRLRVVVAIIGVAALWLVPGKASGQIFLTENDFYGSAYFVWQFNTSGNETSIQGFPSSPEAAEGETLYNGNLYVSYYNSTGGHIAEFNATTGAAENYNFINASAIDLLEYNGNFYLADNGSGTVSMYSATSGAMEGSGPIITGLTYPYGMAITDGNLLVSDYNTGTISEYNASTGAVENANFITGLYDPEGLAVSGSNLYVVNFSQTSPFAGQVSEFSTSGSLENLSLVSGLTEHPHYIAASGANLYVTSFGASGSGNDGSIGVYNATTGLAVNANFANINGSNGIAVADMTPTPVTPSSQSTQVTTGTSYATVPSATANGGYGSTATILAGTASTTNTVTLAFNGTGTYANFASDVVTVSGMPNKGTGPGGSTLTDMFVLKLTYNPQESLAATDPAGLAILWLDPATGKWVNAIFGNSDGGANEAFVDGAYNPAQDFNLSWFGVDTTDDYAWVVVDHNSTFGVGDLYDLPFDTGPVPEPSTWAMLLVGAGMLVFAMRRRAKV